ncbi:MAG: hypothetical protein AABX01_05690 [Candidatus Micrarchaeota archaeon]
MIKLPAIFALAVFSILLFGCTQTSPDNTPKGSYFEIVREGKALGDLGSKEYLLTGEGLLLRKIKVEFSGRPPLPTDISIWRIPKENAVPLMLQVRGETKSVFEECDNCATYHLFYGDSTGIKVFEAPEYKTPKFITDLPGRMEDIIKTAAREETFFASMVYSKRGIIYDYHIFGDGTVIYEEFGYSPATMANAKVQRMNTGQFFTTIPDAFFEEKDSGNGCNRDGFDYGYVEIAKGEKTNFIFTCGNGQNPSDLVFNQLMNLVEK